MGSTQRVLPGRLRPPLPPVRPVRPPHTYAAQERRESSCPATGLGFSGWEIVNSGPALSPPPSAGSPILGGPARWALPPPSNPGCGRNRLRSGFGLSSPSESLRDWEGGAWATVL